MLVGWLEGMMLRGDSGQSVLEFMERENLSTDAYNVILGGRSFDITIRTLLSRPSSQLWLVENTPKRGEENRLVVERCRAFLRNNLLEYSDHNYSNDIERVIAQLATCGESIEVTQTKLNFLQNVVIKFATAHNDLKTAEGCEKSLKFLKSIVDSLSKAELAHLLDILAVEYVQNDTPLPAVVFCGIVCPLVSKWYVSGGGQQEVDHLFFDFLRLSQPESFDALAKEFVRQGRTELRKYLVMKLENITSLQTILAILAADHNQELQKKYAVEVLHCWEEFTDYVPSEETLATWASTVPTELCDYFPRRRTVVCVDNERCRISPPLSEGSLLLGDERMNHDKIADSEPTEGVHAAVPVVDLPQRSAQLMGEKNLESQFHSAVTEAREHTKVTATEEQSVVVTSLKLRSSGKRTEPRFPRCDIADVICHVPSIGDGSTCDVYRATWRGEECAFKKYRGSVAREIEREIGVAPYLQHEFTVRVLAVVEEGKKPIGLLLALCDRTLSSALRDTTRAPLSMLLRWLHEVAQAIEFAHRYRIVHSDIKPDNIFLSGSEQFAKLADFGSSCVLSTCKATITSPRGTPLFMAPEYAANETGPTLEADIFSFGMTMWCVLSPPGANHGLGSNPIQLQRALDKGSRPPLRGIDIDLGNLISKCWHHDSLERPLASSIVDSLRSAREAVAPSATQIPSSELWRTVLRFAKIEVPFSALQWQQTDKSWLSFSPSLTVGEPCFEFLTSQLDPHFHHRHQILRFQMVGLSGLTISSFLTQHISEAHSRATNENLRLLNSVDVSAAMNRLKSAFTPIDEGDLDTARILLAWHGTSPESITRICRDRPRSLRTTDAGFFGAGSYFALEASYAAKFPKNFDDTPENEPPKERAMVLFAVSVSQAKVITVADDYLDDYNTPHLHGFSKYYSGNLELAYALAPGHDAHFIPVKDYGYINPKTKIATPRDVDYQAVDNEDEATAHEIVTSSHHQCVPIAVMYYYKQK